MIDRVLDNLVCKKENLIHEIMRKDAHIKRLLIKQDCRLARVRVHLENARQIIIRMGGNDPFIKRGQSCAK